MLLVASFLVFGFDLVGWVGVVSFRCFGFWLDCWWFRGCWLFDFCELLLIVLLSAVYCMYGFGYNCLVGNL